MGAASEFDVGPLTWVKGEIEQALAKAAEALDAYAANPLDSAQLKYCKTHLHQAHGALEIVGLEGVTKLTEECEHLLDSIEAGTLTMSVPVRDALKGAFARLTEYLNELVDGAPHQPVRLFPAYKAVMELRGAERIAETDLFFPDLSARPPKREVAEMPADMREHVLAQRRRFQMGLLRWLRNSGDSGGLKEMGEAVRGIEKMQAMPQHRAFWWVTIGFTETLQAAGDQAGLDAKRLCARIDLQMKRLMEGSQNVAERLMRDALFFVAKSRADSAQVKEIRALYGLEGVMAEDNTGKRDVKPYEGTLRTIREILASAKDKWNQFSAGQTHELASFKEQAVQLEEKAKALGHPDFAKLTNAISKVTMWVAENPTKVTESIALETATALLLAENATENFARLSDEFPVQVNAMGMRLKASLAGQTANVPEVPMLDEMTRKAQERLLMAQVVSEIKSNLSTIEGALDGFFRDTAKRGELPALDGQIRQVQGALTILGADKAVAALAVCQADIARFATPDYEPQQADFEKVANTMSGLGFFVEALQHGPADFDAVMQPIAPKKKGYDEEPAPGGVSPDWSQASQAKNPDGSDDAPEQALTVEAELEQEKKDARSLFDAWHQKPQDQVLAAELKASLEAIKQDADLVDEPSLSTTAKRALDLLAQAPADAAAMGDLSAQMQQISPAVAAPAAPPPAAPEARRAARPAPAALPPEEVDAELLAIFLEEAEEVMGTIGEHLKLVTAEPGNKEYFTVIRRAFHTLKGSGRMVGLMRFGDAAWAIEQTMNHWLQENKPVTPDLLGLIGRAHELFSGWVRDLATTGALRRRRRAADRRRRTGAHRRAGRGARARARRAGSGIGRRRSGGAEGAVRHHHRDRRHSRQPWALQHFCRRVGYPPDHDEKRAGRARRRSSAAARRTDPRRAYAGGDCRHRQFHQTQRAGARLRAHAGRRARPGHHARSQRHDDGARHRRCLRGDGRRGEGTAPAAARRRTGRPVGDAPRRMGGAGRRSAAGRRDPAGSGRSHHRSFQARRPRGAGRGRAGDGHRFWRPRPGRGASCPGCHLCRGRARSRDRLRRHLRPRPRSPSRRPKPRSTSAHLQPRPRSPSRRPPKRRRWRWTSAPWRRNRRRNSLLPRPRRGAGNRLWRAWRRNRAGSPRGGRCT